MKQEEESVDIDDPVPLSAVEPNANLLPEHAGLNGILSAELDEEPDEDICGWKLKIIVTPEDGEENV